MCFKVNFTLRELSIKLFQVINCTKNMIEKQLSIDDSNFIWFHVLKFSSQLEQFLKKSFFIPVSVITTFIIYK